MKFLASSGASVDSEKATGSCPVRSPGPAVLADHAEVAKRRGWRPLRQRGRGVAERRDRDHPIKLELGGEHGGDQTAKADADHAHVRD